MGTLIWLVVGALSGLVAGKLMRGGGFGIILNIILGIAGAWVGTWLFAKLNIQIGTGYVHQFAAGVAGAVVILLIAGLFSSRRK